VYKRQHRDLHPYGRRQRQMCIRDSFYSATFYGLIIQTPESMGAIPIQTTTVSELGKN
jgi:hypothetical protein